MPSLIYKRLFEIKFLHEYYLSESARTTYFSLPENLRSEQLNKKIKNGFYDIRRDLAIKPTPLTERFLKGHQMLFRMTNTGFLIGLRVRSAVNNLGVEEFLPAISWDSSKEMSFTMEMKNPKFKNFTNLKLFQATPAVFYFENTDTDSTKVFPSLSNPVNPYQIGTTYEMGELADFSGTVKEAITRTASSVSSDWQDILGDGYVSENDRILLPHLFNYRFPIPVSSARFILRDQNDILKIDYQEVVTHARSVFLLDLRIDTNGDNIGDGKFKLEVLGDGNRLHILNLVLSEEKYIPTGFGTISISTNSNDPNFRLINNSGALITERTNGQMSKQHPIFEIRLKSRQTVWRYVSKNGKTLFTTPLSAPYLEPTSGALQSKVARPLLVAPIEFEDTDPLIDTIFLPNPRDHTMRSDGNRYYSDIYVSKIKTLINE